MNYPLTGLFMPGGAGLSLAGPVDPWRGRRYEAVAPRVAYATLLFAYVSSQHTSVAIEPSGISSSTR
jgi:hypothetical protein